MYATVALQPQVTFYISLGLACIFLSTFSRKFLQNTCNNAFHLHFLMLFELFLLLTCEMFAVFTAEVNKEVGTLE